MCAHAYEFFNSLLLVKNDRQDVKAGKMYTSTFLEPLCLYQGIFRDLGAELTLLRNRLFSYYNKSSSDRPSFCKICSFT